MAYYPKSQIRTGFYAYLKDNTKDDGDTFVYKYDTTIPYEGPYFITSDGKYFSGLSPSSGNNYEILPYFDPQNDIGGSDSLFTQENALYSLNYNYNLDGTYDKMLNNDPPQTQVIPGQGINLPTKKDYQIGEFRRYFCKKTNELKYLELDQVMFNRISRKDPLVLYSLYTPFFLSWKLTGLEEEVARVNKNIVDLTSKRYSLKQFGNFLNNNYTKYYKP